MSLITVKARNGEELTAPDGTWLSAILSCLAEDAQNSVFEKAEKIESDRRSKLITRPNGIPPVVTIDSNGKKHHRMFAEPGEIGLTGQGIGMMKKKGS